MTENSYVLYMEQYFYGLFMFIFFFKYIGKFFKKNHKI